MPRISKPEETENSLSLARAGGERVEGGGA